MLGAYNYVQKYVHDMWWILIEMVSYIYINNLN